jgi:hypothetical protein
MFELRSVFVRSSFPSCAPVVRIDAEQFMGFQRIRGVGGAKSLRRASFGEIAGFPSLMLESLSCAESVRSP